MSNASIVDPMQTTENVETLTAASIAVLVMDGVRFRIHGTENFPNAYNGVIYRAGRVTEENRYRLMGGSRRLPEVGDFTFTDGVKHHGAFPPGSMLTVSRL